MHFVGIGCFHKKGFEHCSFVHIQCTKTLVQPCCILLATVFLLNFLTFSLFCCYNLYKRTTVVSDGNIVVLLVDFFRFFCLRPTESHAHIFPKCTKTVNTGSDEKAFVFRTPTVCFIEWRILEVAFTIAI